MRHLKMKNTLFSLFSIAFLLCISFTDAAFFGSDCGNNKTHNFYFGAKAPYQSLLYTKHVFVENKFLRKISVDVSFPAKGTRPLGLIKYIEALDQTSEGTGGCVFISNGGIGSSNVSFHIKSQRNHGLDFYLFVYGTLYY